MDADLLVAMALANCASIELSLDFEHTNPPQRREHVAKRDAEQANGAVQQRVGPSERLRVDPARDLLGHRGLNRAEKPPFDAFNGRRGGGA